MWPFRRKPVEPEQRVAEFTYEVKFNPQNRKYPYTAIITETTYSWKNWDPIMRPMPHMFRNLDAAHSWAKAEIEKVKRLRAERDAFNASGLGEPRG